MSKNDPSTYVISDSAEEDRQVRVVTSRPTSVRYVMIFLAMLVAVLLYLDRICMSTAAESVAQDLKISKPELDWLLGAFFWTYALGQLPAGWLGDRFGARWMLSAYVVLWSLSTGLMGFANGVGAVLTLRLLTGLFEAGAYPVAASIVRRWVPIERRGVASSMIAVGGRLGGTLAPILTIQLMLWWTYGIDYWSTPDNGIAAITSWRPVMVIYGVVGIAVAAVFVVFFRDRPDQHPRTNEAEAILIRGNNAVQGERTTAMKSPPVFEMICSWPMWLNCFVQFSSNLAWAFLVTSLPMYLSEVHQSTQRAQGLMQSLPLAAGIAGLLLGGMFTDFFTRTFGLRWGRSITMCASRLVVALAYLGCLIVDGPIEAVLCLALVGLATDLGIGAVWAFGQDVGGQHVGSVVGWGNMWGNFGAALSPVFLGLIVRSFANPATGWKAAFVALAIIQLVAAIAALGVNASKPLRNEN
jgi:MFS family permease